MRLEKYLIEAVPELIDNIPKAREAIERDCKKYIKEIGGDPFDHQNLLYRGKDGWDGNSLWRVRERGKPRRPKDTPEILHKIANVAFKKKFGWPVRDGVFTTSDSYTASDYGRTGVFYPIGSYKYVWSPEIADFYEDVIQDMGMSAMARMKTFDDFYKIALTSIAMRLYTGDPLKDFMDKKLGKGFEEEPELVTRELVREWVDDMFEGALRTYTNRGLSRAIDKRTTEVSFNVKEYYLAPTWIYD